MKKIIILAYASLMLLTLLGCLLFTVFRGYNALFCELSLLISMSVSLSIVSFKIDPVYKISMVIGATILAAVSYLISMFMPNSLTNNVALFIQAVIIIVEVLALASARYFTRFA
ncbi:hypothetical protein [Mucilaginibacter ginsenosidivorax]|uniref:Uncharacterized protein n=1 Tax=Mucilaginibacter ginsenosidivorax TaxID=862126 RepID=A0A5B8W9P8_9SPHI|nr:hypothetical protein [Mucilaginibacter ginsenosidivorax]QEC79706.1 hypothetical protein FSB76_28520 [Mucilaginibacter ginsenosidivorax]